MTTFTILIFSVVVGFAFFLGVVIGLWEGARRTRETYGKVLAAMEDRYEDRIRNRDKFIQYQFIREHSHVPED